jgi:hypothetical protein
MEDAQQQQQQQQQLNGSAPDSRPCSSGSDSTCSTDSIRSLCGSSSSDGSKIGAEDADADHVKNGSSRSNRAAAVLLPPGACYTVRLSLTTSSRRKRSQAELGVISQMCVVTAAVAVVNKAAQNADSADLKQQQASVSLLQGPVNGKGQQRSSNGGSSQRLGAGMPSGWQLLVAGVPVAGGLVGQLADLQVGAFLSTISCLYIIAYNMHCYHGHCLQLCLNTRQLADLHGWQSLSLRT